MHWKETRKQETKIRYIGVHREAAARWTLPEDSLKSECSELLRKAFWTRGVYEQRSDKKKKELCLKF